MFKNMFKNLTVKQRQRIKVFTVIAVVLLIIIVGISFTGKKTEQKQIQEKKDRKFSILSEKVEKDLWVAAEGQNIKALEKSNEEMKNELEKLRKEFEESKQQASKQQALKQQALKQQASKQQLSSIKNNDNNSKIPPPSAPPPPETSDKKPKGKETKPNLLGKSEEKTSTIKIWQSDEKKTEKEDKKSKKGKNHIWVPTGSITKAVLLSGMDVPTSMGAKSEPYPILMTLIDYSILPNRFKMDMKECFIVGAGYGNMVEERAYIRTETLSCIRNDGSPWEVSLKGQIMGEDGKLGLRGKVITKQGKQIAMSIVTGVLAGLGDALKPQTALSYIDLDKSEDQVRTITPRVGDVLSGAGLAGTGIALNRISDYYLKMAEQMYPVIEIEAGREVEIIIVKGGKLTPQEDTQEDDSKTTKATKENERTKATKENERPKGKLKN